MTKTNILNTEVQAPNIPLVTMKVNSDYEFITKFDMMDDITIYNNVDDNYANVSLKWEAYIEARSWGIKSMGFYTLRAQIEIFDSETDQSIQVIDTYKDNAWEVCDERSHIKIEETHIKPHDVEINLEDKTIYINW